MCILFYGVRHVERTNYCKHWPHCYKEGGCNQQLHQIPLNSSHWTFNTCYEFLSVHSVDGDGSYAWGVFSQCLPIGPLHPSCILTFLLAYFYSPVSLLCPVLCQSSVLLLQLRRGKLSAKTCWCQLILKAIYYTQHSACLFLLVCICYALDSEEHLCSLSKTLLYLVYKAKMHCGDPPPL